MRIQYPSISYRVNPYKLADIPLILKKNSSAIKLNNFAGPLNPENEPKQHLDFNEKIPLSLFLPDIGDREKKKHIASRKRKLRSKINNVRLNTSLSSSHPQKMKLTSRRQIINNTNNLTSK